MKKIINSGMRYLEKYHLVPIFGLILIAVYWFSIRPGGLERAYSGDMCADVLRQILAETSQLFGGPRFETTSVMAPTGASAPFMSWSIERDWLGSVFWTWNRDFPYFWAYFGVSLLICFVGVGTLLKKMKLPGTAAWGIATLVALFHVPRHYKIWHHLEYAYLHWIYLGIFLDALIFQRFWRERKFSWNLELWRIVFLFGVLGTTGYFWGPMGLEWALVRICILGKIFADRRSEKSSPLQIDWNLKSSLIPITTIALLIYIDAQFFIPLIEEAKKFGEIWQGIGWSIPMPWIIRPLWLYALLDFRDAFFPDTFSWQLSPIDTPETVVSIGWVYLVPFAFSLWALRKKRNGAGLGVLLPFLILLIIAILYIGLPYPYPFQTLVQMLVPTMKFFRVTTRWGIFLPPLITACIVMAFPEIQAWFKKNFRSRKHGALLFLFCFLSLLEMKFLLTPINTQPPMNANMKELLETVRKTPGTTVLDMPFCVAGGNGICTGLECPNYPHSTIGVCLREWHEKKVYGLYQARMTEAHCDLYKQAPYLSWFSAWREQRCFTAPEWTDFCHYLDLHPEISGVLLYPGIWKGADTPECRAQFESYLGPPIRQGDLLITPTRGGQGADPTEVRFYPAQCRNR